VTGKHFQPSLLFARGDPKGPSWPVRIGLKCLTKRCGVLCRNGTRGNVFNDIVSRTATVRFFSPTPSFSDRIRPSGIRLRLRRPLVFLLRRCSPVTDTFSTMGISGVSGMINCLSSSPGNKLECLHTLTLFVALLVQCTDIMPHACCPKVMTIGQMTIGQMLIGQRASGWF
jgi:hypothetical protein